MLPLTVSVTLPDGLGPWLAMIGFGAYHGLNPGMGWLFALSLGLQQWSERAIWASLFPIAAGHAASVALVAAIVLAGMAFVSSTILQLLTAVMLLAFGIYKMVNYYRHPRWVGMKVRARDLFAWSFLMATAHGAGLMVAPALVGVASMHGSYHGSPGMLLPPGAGLFLAVSAHTFAMFTVMGVVARIVYTKLGLTVLRQKWINFDLIWAVALLIVGGIALFTGM
jgi:hypothetical protein